MLSPIDKFIYFLVRLSGNASMDTSITELTVQITNYLAVHILYTLSLFLIIYPSIIPVKS